MRLPHGEPEQLTSDPSDDFSPQPSPDGRELAFHSWRAGSRDIYVLPLDGGPVQQVTSSPLQELRAELVARRPSAWSTPCLATREAFGSCGGIRPAFGARRWSEPRAWDLAGVVSRRTLDRVYQHIPGWFTLRSLVLILGRPAWSWIPPIPGASGRRRHDWSRDSRTLYFKSGDARGNAAFWAIPATGGTPRLLIRFDDPTVPPLAPNGSSAKAGCISRFRIGRVTSG